MQQVSTYCVELTSSLERALEEVGLGRRVSSACPKRPLSTGAEFFQGHALLSSPLCTVSPPTRSAPQRGSSWEEPGDGAPRPHPRSVLPAPLSGPGQARGKGLPLAWTVFPSRVPCEHLLIFQVSAADYLT